MTFDTRIYSIITDSKKEDAGRFRALEGVWDSKNSAWLVPEENMHKFEDVMKGSDIFVDKLGASHFLVTGNAFSIKDHLKALGGKWDAEVKGWKFQNATRAAVQRILDGFIPENRTPKVPPTPNTPELKL